MRNLLVLLFITFLYLPQIAFGAGISFSEVMYDASGSDGGREWVEIYNNSGSDIDLTSYKFFENGTAHSISHLEGDALLLNNSYAIIADNANNFISEFPDASKQNVYDASFSLSNSNGEYLALKNKDGDILAEITYDPNIGAAGDGNSLQRNNAGSWIASLPTILSGFVLSNDVNNTTQNSVVDNTGTSSTPSGSSSAVATKKQIGMHFEFSIPKNIIVGNDNMFKTTLYGDSGEIINYGEFVWNFGDGTVETVKNLNEINHIYLYPGDYTVTCTYKYTWNPKPILVGRTNVLAIASPFELTHFYSSPKPAIGIINKRDTEYDISKYIIKTNNGDVILPEGTFIGGKDEVVFLLPAGVYDKNSISLLNPLHMVVSSFSAEVTVDINKPVIGSNLNKPKLNDYVYSLTQNTVYNEPPDDTPEPKIIELQANAQKANNDFILPAILIILILLGSVCIFYVRAIRKNEESIDADDYTLQDE